VEDFDKTINDTSTLIRYYVSAKNFKYAIKLSKKLTGALKDLRAIHRLDRILAWCGKKAGGTK
jgi:hypothetical protein